MSTFIFEKYKVRLNRMTHRESLYKSLSGDGNPAYTTTVAKVIKALGVRLAAETAHC